MHQDINRIKVNLTNSSYEVAIGIDIIYSIGEELLKLKIKDGTRILVISNPDVASTYSKQFMQSLISRGFKAKLLVIEAGEEQKTPSSISRIHDAAYEHEIERNSLIIALGGGVVGDMAGFAASTWLRGIPFIQVPTTLLAMVDASVGGKTGVNHPKGKNLIGAFHQPKLVLIDINTLKTLPEREFRSGMAEVIKYGIIKDNYLFKQLEQKEDLSNLNNLGLEFLSAIIVSSVKTKANIVQEDEKEEGVRAILNYGHTFGHVIETLCGYGNYLHGEAVAIGMNVAGMLSVNKNLFAINDLKRQERLIVKAGLPITWPKLEIKQVLRSLKGDKKVLNGNLRFILPVKIGQVIINSRVSIEEITSLLNSFDCG